MRPAARVARASGPVVIDGRLDEATWQDADSLTDFVQSKPRAGYPATEQTVVRLLYDAERIYIGAQCDDSEAGRLTVPSQEDSGLLEKIFTVKLTKLLAF